MKPSREARLAGIFVGGASRRMGGKAKGLLRVPGGDEPIVVRLVRLSREAGLEPVLVGDASAYATLGLKVPAIADDPPGVGPLGGLAALLEYAGEAVALALACDMPFVSAQVLRTLAAPGWNAPVVAPRRGEGGPWEPLLARYDAPRVRPTLRRSIQQGVRSFQRLFALLEVEPVVFEGAVDPARDWDTPQDIGHRE